MLQFLDRHVLTEHVYPQTWAEDDITRQFLSLMGVVILGGSLLYLSCALLNYLFVFDHRLMKHPHFLPNQVRSCLALVRKSDVTHSVTL